MQCIISHSDRIFRLVLDDVYLFRNFRCAKRNVCVSTPRAAMRLGIEREKHCAPRPTDIHTNLHTHVVHA